MGKKNHIVPSTVQYFVCKKCSGTIDMTTRLCSYECPMDDTALIDRHKNKQLEIVMYKYSKKWNATIRDIDNFTKR